MQDSVLTEERARSKNLKEFNAKRTNIHVSDKKARSGGLKYDMRESLQATRFTAAAQLNDGGSRTLNNIPTRFDTAEGSQKTQPGNNSRNVSLMRSETPYQTTSDLL